MIKTTSDLLLTKNMIVIFYFIAKEIVNVV